MLEAIKSRPPAKLLKDVDIPDESWKPDFDVVDRYQSLANEIMRVSLLGIAGYGFLIKECCMKDDNLKQTLHAYSFILITGIILLGLSLVCVLFYRFYSTDCLYHQILIMRSLKRLENKHWNADEKDQEKIFLAKARKTQTIISIRSHSWLVRAATLFALGLIAVIVVFSIFLT